jgi:hypothetical protein
MLKRENIMKMGLNNNWVAQFIDNVGKNILSSVEIGNYFSLSGEKKLITQYLVFKIIYKSISMKIKEDKETMSIVVNFILKKSEENENYELSEVMKDIKLNHDKLTEMTNTSIKQPTPTKRPISVNKSNENKD